MDIDVPVRFLDTIRVAPDTHLVRQLAGEGVNPVAMHCNSMVITGSEPVIVDCGPAITRDEWMARTFELVEPADVRWIFLSHDDVDHVGNLQQVLEVCRHATVVSTAFMVERMAADAMLPLDRLRWVNDGETFRAGDRTFTAVVPPTFDSPTTRGLFDHSTGVYWAADSFGAPVPFEVDDIDDLPDGFYGPAFVQTQQLVSPWHQWLDPAKYQQQLDRIAALGATVVASCHGVTLRDGQIAASLELMQALPGAPAAVLPGQAELEALLAMLSTGLAA